MNKSQSDKIEQAVEYIERLSERTVTPITGWNIFEDDNTVNVFYETSELKQKADDHGTTELLKEMFEKYLKDNNYDLDIPIINFKSKLK